MEKNNSMSWNWIVCNLPLKQFVNSENITWSLQPSITLAHPSGEGPDPQIKILLDQEKSFQYTEELGWNWHKSWKLPTISLNLEVTDSEKGDALLCPKDIYVHIFAVKALVDSNNKLCLVDVGLRGVNKMELIDGKALFQTLKFASTSYNNEGVKFHLLVCIYLQISEDTKPKILKAIISPPIFVDSRKSVRDNDKLSENKLFLYIEPFYPDNFTRKFVKKETKKRESIEEEIQNTIDGLHSYLTAPNIRNKVKHPIFLCVRFSSCVALYYNPSLVTEEEKENAVEFFQSLMLEDVEKSQDLTEPKIQDSYFVLWINKNEIEDKLKKKKILEILSPIKSRSLSVTFNKAEVPLNFVQIQDLRWLMELYSKTYSKLLLKSKFCLRGEDENDEEEGPTDKIPPPEKQVISFTHEPATRTQADWSKYLDTSVSEESTQKKLKSEDPNTAPVNMMEARTISYRESMSKLFPNNQNAANAAQGNNAMFPGIKQGNMMPMGNFPNKGVAEGLTGGMPQFPTPALHGMGAGLTNPAIGRLAAGRNQPYGMDQMMMMNKLNQMNYLNMMNQLGRGGQPFGGMNNMYSMMGGKDGDMMGGQMSAERMQAMMQNLQQYQQMYGRDEVKTENTGDITVKVQGDGEGEEERNAQRANRRTNDINVKDEESMN